MEEQTRAYIYRIAVAVIPILILYGVLSESEAGLWIGVLAAVLSLGESALAAANTSPNKLPEPVCEERPETTYEERHPEPSPVDPEDL